MAGCMCMGRIFWRRRCWFFAAGAFVLAKLIRPESESPETGSHFPLTIDRGANNVLEAATNGTRDGLMLYLNVLAMLISFR